MAHYGVFKPVKMGEKNMLKSNESETSSFNFRVVAFGLGLRLSQAFFCAPSLANPMKATALGSVGKVALASSGPLLWLFSLLTQQLSDKGNRSCPAWLHPAPSTIRPISPASPSLPGEKIARSRAGGGLFRQSLVIIAALCCCASMAQGGEDIALEDVKQVVAVHDTSTNPFIVPSIGGRIGDPFPSYWDGVWHVYTLRKGLDVVLHFTSTDLVVWNEHRPAMTGSGIATGTVVRHDNKYYLFYTDAEPQTIRLVTSDNPWYFDFSTSVLIAEADQEVYTLEKKKFRDCYVFYYEKEKRWWMLVEATSQGNVAVALFKSKDLLNWTQHDPIFMDPVRGHGSCPQLIEKGGRWYLPMLDYPTWYYVANDPYGPWKLGGFYHTKRMSAASRWDTDSKRWLGWGFFTTDDTPEGDLDWGAYGPMCVGRELVFNKDGSLGVRPIPELVEALRESEGHATLYACTKIRSGTWVIDPGKKQLRSTDDQGGVLMFDLPEKNSTTILKRMLSFPRRKQKWISLSEPAKALITATA